MINIQRLLFLVSLLGLFGFSMPWPFSWLVNPVNPERLGSYSWVKKQTLIIKSLARNIDPYVAQLSLIAYINARKKGLDTKGLLTVIDYSRPSTEKRLWIFDLKRNRLLFNTYVAHGKNSGDIHPTAFSNDFGSLKSSLGLFLTGETYVGGEGYSLRLRGLEHGVNDNAYRRDIVIHGAKYVDADTIRKYGQIGKSWGCPAVGRRVAPSIINTIKENTLVFAYYPDRRWLSHSVFLSS